MDGVTDFRPWDELTPDVLGLIFKNLRLEQNLQVIPLVCKSWCKAVEGPYCWQRIDDDRWSLRLISGFREKHNRIARMLITRSSGSLRELSLSFIDNDMMLFVAEHAGSLQTLEVFYPTISDSIVEQVAPKFSSLTALELTYCRKINPHTLEVIGINCKMLVSLSLQMLDRGEFDSYLEEVAWVIARVMPKLKNLRMNLMLTTRNALGILSGCPELETFEILGCSGVSLEDQNFLQEKYPNLKFLDRV